MERLKLAFCIAFALGSVGLAVYVWTRPQPPKAPALPPPYTAFEVEIDGPWILVRNAGGEVLTDCGIDFVADLDSPHFTTYHGWEFYKRWEPGEVREIGITTSRGPTDVRSVRFTGTARATGKEWKFWELAYPAAPPGG